jgi:hypothetical protein
MSFRCVDDIGRVDSHAAISHLGGQAAKHGIIDEMSSVSCKHERRNPNGNPLISSVLFGHLEFVKMGKNTFSVIDCQGTTVKKKRAMGECKLAGSRSSNPLSLGHMTSSVHTVLKSQLATTFQEVADQVVRELGLDPRDVENERTLRRRVYDVLNVFVAMGLVIKEGKSIRYRPSETLFRRTVSSANLQDKEIRIRSLELDLIGKSRILVGWELLISRNRSLPRPTVTIPVTKTLFVGFKSASDGCYDQALDGHKITVHSESPPDLFSPLEVIDKLNFTLEDRYSIINQHPTLHALIPLLFPDNS